VTSVTSDQRKCVLAVNLAGGTAYCAVASPPGELVEDDLVRIELAEGLGDAEQLADFAARFRQELRRLRPVAVGVIQTTKTSQWVYSYAWRRVTVESAIMLTTVEASTSEHPIDYKLLKPSAMAKAVDIPLRKLYEVAGKRWGAAVPKYRKDRLPAVVGALALAREFCP
jgi:hypothetical protein